MKVQVTGSGIYGAKGEVKVGTIIEVSSIPASWKKRVAIIEDSKTAVTNPKQSDDDDAERDKLRADYLELTGKKADGRWSVEKLNEELEKAAE